MNSNNPTLKYILYARKSSESEDRQMASIEDQITEMKRLAKKQGLCVVDIIKESKSAKAPGRKKFGELLTRIHKKEANAILVWKLNRLARNPIDGGQISWMLQQSIISHIQTFGSDYKPSDNVLLMQIEFGMATQFVKDLSVSVSRGMRLKAERGWFPASRLPVGYSWEYPNSKGKDKRIILDPVQFPLIRDAWRDMLSGEYSILSIERKLYKKGLRNSKGNRFGQAFFYRLFQNEFYCGYFLWKDADGNPTRHKGKHKPMISESEFLKVQKKFFTPKAHGKSNDEFLFRGLLRCGECNRAITAQRKVQCICRCCKFKFSSKVNSFCPKCNTKIKDMENPIILDNTYYHCSNPKRKCSQLPINGKQLEKKIESLLKVISIDRDFFVTSNEIIEFNSKDLKFQKQDKTKLLKKDIENIKRKIKNLTLLRASQEIEADEYKQFKDELLDQIRDIEKIIEQIENEQKYQFDEELEYLEISKNLILKYENGSMEAKRLLISKFSSNLTLFDKNLYFSMPKALYLILIKYKAYKEKKLELEPKKSFMYQGDFTFFTLPLSVGEPMDKKIEPCFIITTDNNTINQSKVVRLDYNSVSQDDIWNAAA